MIVETRIQRNYGTDHEYIVQPPGLAKVWSEITGRKTVTATDLAQIESIGSLFFLYDETVQGDDVSKAIVIEREAK
tara:strand:- start:316 stop:543 length:228 start_codon:yes stop_codon:yes gene_type:complete